MEGLMTKYIIFVIISIYSIKKVSCINCFQCSGTNSDEPFECNEYLNSDSNLQQSDCETIHDAKYCIKHVGRYEGNALDCYQCNSSSNMECGDGLMNLDGGILRPISCDHVYNAVYCIKQIGGISTKRFCSSLDLGNYCNYVQQPGDKLEYRTCIYTCSSDGCNSGTSIRISAIVILSLFIFCCFCNYCNMDSFMYIPF